jgi:glycerophosphoryl diester phosphodiesterase
MKLKQDFLIIAHRGASKAAPENTLKSFKKAIELGADYIEFDVHKTKDDNIVVIHDENTYRTTGEKGEIKNMTLEEVKHLRIEEDEQIPTLQEVIDLAKGKVGLQCEIKAPNLAAPLIDALRNASLIEETIISSFNLDELTTAYETESNVRIASLEPTGNKWIKGWESKKQAIKRAHTMHCYAIHPLYRLIDEEAIDYAHQLNLRVHPWTVDSKIAIKKLIKWGVDGLITNDVEKVQSIIDEV